MIKVFSSAHWFFALMAQDLEKLITHFKTVNDLTYLWFDLELE